MFRELILRIPQPLRFLSAGGFVFVWTIAATLLLNTVGLPIQVAIPLGYVSGLVLHFSLQRYYVFVNHDAFGLAIHHQLGRYALSATTQYLLTAGLTAALPGLLGLHERTVYAGVAVVLTALSFLVNRAFVFHGAADAPPPEPTTAA